MRWGHDFAVTIESLAEIFNCFTKYLRKTNRQLRFNHVLCTAARDILLDEIEEEEAEKKARSKEAEKEARSKEAEKETRSTEAEKEARSKEC